MLDENVAADFRDAPPEMLNELTKVAFRARLKMAELPLSKYDDTAAPTPYLTATPVRYCYRPRLHEHSHILADSYVRNKHVVHKYLPKALHTRMRTCIYTRRTAAVGSFMGLAASAVQDFGPAVVFHDNSSRALDCGH